MSSLLARFAENSFWMARYMQRAENLARIIDVNETFSRNAEGEHDWLPILRLHRDEELFGELYSKTDGPHVVRFYLIDDENPNSIRRCAYFARENARSIRHLISLETWVQLNVFYNWIRVLTKRDLKVSELSRLCGKIKDSCELHFGIAESTLYRDQIYLFYKLGQLIELCDQTTRLVDIKYHALLPSADDVGTPLDVSQWNALLRSASAYHGYRRVFPHEMTPVTVAGFILLDSDFPRSIRHCARRIDEILDRLLERPELGGVDFDRTTIEDLQSLAGLSAGRVVAEGLNDFIDRVQLKIIRLGEQINEKFFLAQHAGESQPAR